MPPSPYPRIYEPTRGWRIFLYGLAAALAIPGLAGTWYFATHESKSAAASFAMVAFWLFWILAAIYVVLTTGRSKIVLFADRIEIHELTITKTLLRNEIAAIQILGVALRLEPKDTTRKAVATAIIYRFDDAFWDWFDEIPDRDDDELLRAYQEIQQDDKLGASRDERIDTIEKAQRLCRAFDRY